MKHTKREWMPLYSFLDRKRVTDHLADMAARGWMLDRLGTWSWHYRRTEPKQLRFAVTFFAGAGRFSPAPAAGLDTLGTALTALQSDIRELQNAYALHQAGKD